jgi:hypothetical protein
MLIQFDRRELTPAERDEVAPRVKRIERLRHVLAQTTRGDAWTNKISKELRTEERVVRKYLRDRQLHAVRWRDENGRERFLEIVLESKRDLFKVTIR